MCIYKDICPVYDEWKEICNDRSYETGCLKCIPLLLEAYHDLKGTDYGEIREYLLKGDYLYEDR